MPENTPTLHLLCGKIAAGKSTLAGRLGKAPGTVLIAEDDWLDALYPGALQSPSDYQRYASRLRQVVAPHAAALLNAGVSVVLDFPANTVAQRDWMRRILEQTKAAHQLHFLAVPDAVCLARLRARNLRGDHPFAVTEAQFRQFTDHFVAPSSAEGFHVLRHSEGA